MIARPELADALAGALLREGGWYASFDVREELVVVFASKKGSDMRGETASPTVWTFSMPETLAFQSTRLTGRVKLTRSAERSHCGESRSRRTDAVRHVS